ncbi:MAG: zinc-binding dehydrogenase [Sphingomonas sp.]|uniref:zinc-binding dehydrogenase n=1 Tax=Sphingomonas sp. TaxID=28214 RepID=UPI0017F80CAA|nr:zinc-binding dehydrogenase [Sphingomonas sp.]MBA3667606.1 zinc-binding dehydrogenase [Sphingomonas sp.]
MRAIQVHEFGSPRVMRIQEVADPHPGDGQVVIEVSSAGVMFRDTMVRSGSQPGVELHYIPGNEVGGIVIAVGAGVDANLVGQQFVARLQGSGGYAERAIASVGELLAVPDGLTVQQAVALLANGRTALGIVREARIGPTDRVLVEAAAGGVGSLLVQLARNAGAAMVIGAARGERKLQLLRELGVEAVDYGNPAWPDHVRELTAGEGIDVVLDGLGGEIALAAFELLRGAGRMIVFGYASGTPVELTALDTFRRGASIVGYSPPRVMRRPDEMRQLSEEVMHMAAAGALKPIIGQSFPLKQAAEAHQAIEARETTGKVLLEP